MATNLSLDIGNGWILIVISLAGLVINTIGTLVFGYTGLHHGHHSHKHGHSHGHYHSKESHVRKEKKKDLNVYSIFIHYLGDMISSIFVLISGLLLHFFKDQMWIKYIDPASR